MSRLHPEIWLSIFDALDNEVRRKTDLRSVCQASHTFYELAEPLLFANISLDTDDVPHQRTLKLISVLKGRPETRRWVKSVVIDTSRSDGASESIVQDIADLFVELHHLRKIYIAHMSLTDDMVRHLYRLRRPFSFRCWRVSCSTEVAGFDPGVQTLQIRQLTVEEVRAPNIAASITHLAQGPHLSSLKLSRSAALHAYRIPVLNSNHRFDNLRYLEVSTPWDGTDPDSFKHFLAACPSVVHLRIHPGLAFVEESFILPPTTLPLLSHYHGPYVLAALFVAGRPLDTLVLLSHRRQIVNKASLSQLVQGASPLRKLEMGEFLWYEDVLLDIAEYLPALQSLKLWVANKGYLEWVNKGFASDMQRLPQLRIFSISIIEWGEHLAEDLVLDRTALTSLSSANSSLKVVQFRRNTVWWRSAGRWCRKLVPLIM